MEIRKIALILVFLSQTIVAQQVVAPTPEPVGTVRGEDINTYNVLNSFETGYRFRLVDGNINKYRADVNYGNGIRLLGSSLNVTSRDGHGRLFDSILLNTQGLGNDPYESAMLRIEKNRFYRYDMLWRSNEYYNPGLAFYAGEHFMDTRRQLQDHDLVLFPQSRFQFRVGYSRNSQMGPALSTIQLFDSRGDEFPLFSDVQRLRNEYRVGFDAEVLGIKLNVLHRWEFFKEDTPYSRDGPVAGNNPEDLTSLSRFRRSEPYHGASPGWLVNLFRGRKSWIINGRFTYVGGRRDFILDESAAGTSRFGAASNQQIVVLGNARRPVTTGDLSLSFLPGSRLTFINNTSFHNTRIDGDSSFLQFDNATQTSDIAFFQFLGIRTIANASDVHYRAAKWLGLYGGYHFSTRQIRSVESFAIPLFGGERNEYEQDNNLHRGIAGLRLQPMAPLRISLEGEIGRADHPFTPISEANYHAIRARAEYRTRKLQLSTAYQQNYNFNSVSLSAHSARARSYSANASWTPRDRLSLDASYSKLHLDTLSGLAFFAASELVQGRQSIYLSNIHSGNFGAHFGITRRVDLYAGYSITKDTGDGRATPVPPGVTDPISVLLTGVQTFPLTYQSPLARLSLRLHPKLRWNAGWQFYRYHEKFTNFQYFEGYRAHTGYTSLLWSF